MFKSREGLEDIYPSMVGHAFYGFRCTDIFSFLRRKLDNKFQGEAVSDYRKRPEGWRIKFRMKSNSIKMYDKFNCLRIEMTINDPKEFKAYKEVQHRDGTSSRRWISMGKPIANLYRYAEISKAANRRFLDSILEEVRLSKGQKLSRLIELLKMYALYEPYRTTYKESQALKGIAKMKYDREHKDSLEKYPEIRERMQSLLEQGEKITPKQWKAEIQSLQSEYDSIGKERLKTATELAYAEVISYNKKNLEREIQNESRQHNRQQSRTKRREEEI